MDFHALPRRDLQALCKRNGIRANMSNVAMADALAKLPALVDGIEEEEEEAAAAEEGEREMQGIPLPGVALISLEVVIPGDSEEDDKDLMPSPGVGRRRAIRRARLQPAAAPAARKRAAASTADTAAEAVPARTTRARSQRTVVSAPGEETPEARRTPRSAVARKTSTEQEEEEKGIQVSSKGIHGANEDTETVPAISGKAAEEVDFTSGAAEDNETPTSGSVAKVIKGKEPVAAPARTTRRRAAANMVKIAVEAIPARATRGRSQRTVVSDDFVVDLSVQERQADVQQCEDSPVIRNDADSSKEIHHAKEDTETVHIIRGKAAEEVDFTSGAAEENEVPTSGSAAKAIKEKEPVAAPARTTRKRAAASMAEIAVEAVLARTTRARSQRVVVSAPEEVPKLRRTLRSAAASKSKTEQEEEEKGTQGDVPVDCVLDLSVQERQADVQRCEDSPISSEQIQHASEDTKRVPVTSGEAAEEVDFTGTKKSEVPTSDGMLQSAAKAIEKEPVSAPARATRKRAAPNMADIAAKAVLTRTTRARSQRVVVSAPEEEAPKARRAARRAVARKTSMEQEEEEKGTQSDVSDDCVVDSSVQDRQFDVQQCEDTEMVPVKEVPLATLKPGEAAEEVDFTSGANEEDEVPTSGVMLQSAAKATEEKKDMAADEVIKNIDVSVDKEALVAIDEMPLSLATMDESVKDEMVTVDNLSKAAVTDDEGVVKESGFTTDLTDVSIEEEAPVPADGVKEEVLPVDYLSQATVTDDEGAVKETGFSCDLTEVSVEDKGVVETDSMPQSLATLGVEQVVTIDNLSQATVTDDEGAVKERGSIEEDGVVAADEMSQRSTLDESVKEEVATIENLSQATVTDDEWVVKESAFAGDFSDHTATKYMSIDSITLEPMVSEADDVPLRMYNNSGGQKNVAEPVAGEQAKEVKKDKECEALGSLSLRKLRIKLKEKVTVEREKEDKECEALGSLSLRKLRTKLNEKVAVAQENEADDVPSRMYNNSGGQKNVTLPVAPERTKKVKEDKECEALGSLSLRKLRTKLNEKVTVAQENEADVVPSRMYNNSGGQKNVTLPMAPERAKKVKEDEDCEALGSLSLRNLRTKLNEKVTVEREKEGKKGKQSTPMAVDKLSLRKLRMKLKETLNAQKVIDESHPSM